MVTNLLKAPLADYYLLLGIVALLVTVGIMMVFSASTVVGSVKYDSPYYFVLRQIGFLLAGGAIAWWISRRSLVMLHKVAWAGAILAVLCLLLIFVPGIGQEINGNRNWIRFGGPNGLQLQPSEFAKIAIVAWGSALFSANYKHLDQPRKLLGWFLPGSLAMVGLVVLGSDLGTAMLMIAIIFGMLWIVGCSWKILLPLVGAGLAGVGVLVKTSANRMERLFSFAGPGRGEARDDQSIQALYALASGGWWGRGLGGSTQKWGVLPEAHTDYIFAIIGEERGLVGCVGVLLLFLLLGLVGLRVAMRSDQPFARYCAGGITLWFMVQATMNVLVVLRLGPVLGVPLPFLSYGGSAMMSCVVGFGFLLACARYEPAARAALKKRKTPAGPRLISVVDTGRR